MRSLIRWNPQRETALADPLRTMDELFSEMWRGWPSFFDSDTRRPLLRPALDVVENDHEIAIRIDLPGIKQEDVKVELEDNMLTVSGEVGDTIEKDGDRYHYRERSYGSFQRSLRLPGTVDTDKVDASFENGVLNIVLPKLPQAQPKQISIKAGKK